MFAKLLKHELRSTGAVMGVLSLTALLLGVLGTVCIRVLVNHMEDMMHSDSALVLVPIIMIFAMVAVFLGLMAYMIGGSLFVLLRFYRHKFTDEGYLTFTLPVNVHQILLSSWAVILIWETVIFLIMGLCFLSMMFIGTSTSGFFNMEMIQTIAEDFGFMYEVAWGETWEAVGASLITYSIAMVLQILIVPLMTMTSIVLGATVAKKHKLLASLGFYYLINMVTSIVNFVVTFAAIVIAALASAGRGDTSDAVNSVFPFIQPISCLILGVSAYFISVRLMKRKLNLP